MDRGTEVLDGPDHHLVRVGAEQRRATAASAAEQGVGHRHFHAQRGLRLVTSGFHGSDGYLAALWAQGVQCDLENGEWALRCVLSIVYAFGVRATVSARVCGYRGRVSVCGGEGQAASHHNAAHEPPRPRFEDYSKRLWKEERACSRKAREVSGEVGVAEMMGKEE